MSDAYTIRAFLSEARPELGPFGLLGLAPDSCDEEAIDRALRSLLQRIEAHPRSATVEAGQVRLALHAAAAQLRDPAVRGRLASEHAVRAGRDPVMLETPAQENWDAAAAAKMDEAIRRALQGAGGWNRTARREIAAMMAANGAGPGAMMAALGRAAGPRRTMPPAVKNGEQRMHDPVHFRSGESAARLPSEVVQRRRPAWAGPLLTTAMFVSTFLMARTIVLLESGGGPVVGEVVPERIIVQKPASEQADAAGMADEPTPKLNGAEPWRAPAPVERARPAKAAETPAVAAEAASAPRLDTSHFAEAWIKSARILLQPSADASAMDAALARAVRLATLNASVMTHWGGDATRAEQLLQDAELTSTTLPAVGAVSPNETDAAAALTSPGATGDGEVARIIMEIRKQPGQGVQALSMRRGSNTPLGTVDCDVLAEAACFGSPLELRLAARRIILEQRDNPAMINALIETLPRASKQSAISVLVTEVTGSALPRLSDADWPRAARAALVTRLGELIVPARVKAVDELAARLAVAYGAGLGAAAASSNDGAGVGNDRDASGVLAASEAMWRRWSDQARALGPRMIHETEAVLRRRMLRHAVARGPAQRLVADQVCISEVMTLIVGHEQPALAEAARLLVAEASARQRGIPGVFAQVEANEALICRLWMLRLGYEAEIPAAAINPGGGA